MTPPIRESNWTIPNLLTVTRIMLTPGFVMAFVDHRFSLAWVPLAWRGAPSATSPPSRCAESADPLMVSAPQVSTLNAPFPIS